MEIANPQTSLYSHSFNQTMSKSPHEEDEYGIPFKMEVDLMFHEQNQSSSAGSPPQPSIAPYQPSAAGQILQEQASAFFLPPNQPLSAFPQNHQPTIQQYPQIGFHSNRYVSRTQHTTGTHHTGQSLAHLSVVPHVSEEPLVPMDNYALQRPPQDYSTYQRLLQPSRLYSDAGGSFSSSTSEVSFHHESLHPPASHATHQPACSPQNMQASTSLAQSPTRLPIGQIRLAPSAGLLLLPLLVLAPLLSTLAGVVTAFRPQLFPDMTSLVNSDSNIAAPLVESTFVDHSRCCICGKRITRDMTRHMRTHQLEKRFNCLFPKSVCPHKSGLFNRRYDFKKHLLNKHFLFDDPSLKRVHNLRDKLHHWGTCPCGHRFISSDWLDNHILTSDPKLRCYHLRPSLH